MPTSEEHTQIAEKILTKLREWYGSGVDEYYQSGHKLDNFSVTLSGVSMYVEVIWDSSTGNFYRDMRLISRADADIKIAIVNPEILNKENLVRDYQKEVAAQRQRGVKIWGTMINGNRILTDEEYLNVEFKQIIEALLAEFKDIKPLYDYEKKIREVKKEHEIKYKLKNIPVLRIIVASKDEPTEYLPINKETASYLGISPYLKVGKLIDNTLDFYYGEWMDKDIDHYIYLDGTFYIDMPLHYDSELKVFYYNSVMSQIIRYLIYCIIIMKKKGIKKEQIVDIQIKNGHMYRITTDKHFIRERTNKFNSRKPTEMNFTFNPSKDWPELKFVFRDIYMSLFKATGNLYAEDTYAMSSLKHILQNSIREARITNYNLGRYSMKGVTFKDFNFE